MTHIVVDVSFLGYQALNGMGSLSTDEVPTGVLFNILTRIQMIGERYATNSFVFAFDTPADQGLRRKMCPTYKLKREQNRSKEKDPEGAARRAVMRQQLDKLYALLPTLGFTNVFKVEGYEADDIIAAIVGIDFDSDGPGVGRPLVHSKTGIPLSAGWEYDDRFVIVSSDQDLWQCLGKAGRVVMYNPTERTEYGYIDFCSQWGVVPVQWSLIKSIAGCTSDNIDGVEGVAEKTACKYIRGELSLGSKTYNAVRDFHAQQVKNWHLTHLPLNGFPPGLVLRPGAFAGRGPAFKAMCEEYAFASFLREPMFSQWRAFFKGEFAGAAVAERKRPLGRVNLVKPHISTAPAMKNKPLPGVKAIDVSGFGF